MVTEKELETYISAGDQLLSSATNCLLQASSKDRIKLTYSLGIIPSCEIKLKLYHLLLSL